MPRAQTLQQQDLRCEGCNACIAPGGKITCPRCKGSVPIAELSQEGKVLCPKCPEHGNKPKTLAINGAIQCRFCKQQTPIAKEKHVNETTVTVVDAEIVDKKSVKRDREQFVGSHDPALASRMGPKWDGWVYDSVWEYSITVATRGLRATFDATSDVFDRYRIGETVHVALVVPKKGWFSTPSPYLERWCSAMLEMDNVRALT